MQIDIKELKGLEIFLGYTCNLKCKFCYQKNLRVQYSKNIGKEEVINLLKVGYYEGKRFVIFSGGEPSLDKNLPYYVKYSKELGFIHIRVHTNGFGFAKNEYLIDLYNKGLTGVTISVHGYKEVNDSITGVKGSFEIVKNAIKNFELLRRRDNTFVFDTNTVVSKLNYKSIAKLILFLSNFSLTRGQIVLAYSLDLFTKEEKYLIIPEYKDQIKYLEKCLKIAYLYKKKFVLENIPFCVIDKIYWQQILTNIKILKDSITIKEGNSGNTNFSWMINLVKCRECIMNTKCRGLPKDYYEIYGDTFIQTIYD